VQVILLVVCPRDLSDGQRDDGTRLSASNTGTHATTTGGKKPSINNEQSQHATCLQCTYFWRYKVLSHFDTATEVAHL